MSGRGAGARTEIVLLAIALSAGAVLRFQDLAARPMHADEAILADKFGTLLEGGGYTYDPNGHHGPALLYLTLPSAWLSGAATYSELTESILRGVPAAAGLLLAAAPLLLAGGMDRLSLAFAALLTAVSPAMVFYSRYYIPEMLLALFVFAAGACGYRSARSGSAAWAIAAGVAAGLALAAKETAVLAFAAGLAAAQRPLRSLKRSHLAAAAAAAAVTAALLLSGFLAHPRGPADFLRSYFVTYVDAASGNAGHVHPWHYYFLLLWQGEPLLAALAVWGFAAILRAQDAALARRVAVFAAVLAAIYSVLPYKTPWCLLAFWQPAIVVAGGGAARLVRLPDRRARIIAGAALAAFAAALGVQSWRLSRPLAAEPANPYVYAQTGRDVFLIAGRIEEIARVHPDGRRLGVQVFTKENWWPLPWYLRSYPNLGWSRSIPAGAPLQQVILASPDLEPALIRRLYEEPPPGARPLYLHLFPRPVQLRPGVEVRGYIAKALHDHLQ